MDILLYKDSFFTTDYTDFHRLFLFLANGFFTTEDTEFFRTESSTIRHRDLFLIRTENFKELRVTLCYSVVNKNYQSRYSSHISKSSISSGVRPTEDSLGLNFSYLRLQGKASSWPSRMAFQSTSL